MDVDFPPGETDVVIIGAGATGLSVGYFLHQMGYEDAVIIERDYLGSGSTGRCGSGIRAQFSCWENITTMKESVRLWAGLSEKLDFEFHQTGYLYLIYNSQQLDQFKQMRKIQHLCGVSTRLLSPGEVSQLNEHIDTSDLLAAAYNPGDGKADPFRYLLSLWRHLDQESRIGIIQNVEVKNIEKKRGGIEVHTTEGTIRAKRFVNAAGSNASLIGKMVEQPVPCVSHKHQAGITEPVRKNTVEPMIVSLSHQDLYFTQSEDGGIVGGVSEGGETITSDRVETIESATAFSRALSSVMPSLRDLHLLRYWAGHYVVTPDSNPLIGCFDDKVHYIGAGFSGHGYMMAPVVGRSLAELLVKGQTQTDLGYYDPTRFDRGELRQSDLQMG